MSAHVPSIVPPSSYPIPSAAERPAELPRTILTTQSDAPSVGGNIVTPPSLTQSHQSVWPPEYGPLSSACPPSLNKKHPLEPIPSESDGEDIFHYTASKKRKVLKTSFNTDRTPEVRDYMNKRMLNLARMTREVYTAKMKYQRLRMEELEMMRSVVEDELEESQVHFNETGHQIGHIRKQLYDTGILGGDAEEWARIFNRVVGARDNDSSVWHPEQRDGDSASSFVSSSTSLAPTSSAPIN